MSTGGGFVTTHVAPGEGLQVWREPDPSGQVISQVQGGVQLQLLERRGAWARVAFSNGWSGWVDGRRIVDAASPAPPATAPQPQPAAQPQPAPQPQPQQATLRAPVAGGPGRATPPAASGTRPPAAGPSGPRPGPGPARMPTGDLSPTTGLTVPGPSELGAGRAGGDADRDGGGVRRSSSSRRSPMPSIAGVQLTPALIGAAGVLLGTVLSWIRVSGARSNAYDVPLAFLWDYKAGSDGGLKVGLLLLALAIFAGVFTVVPGQVASRRALGGVAIAVAALYTFQLQRLLSAAGELAPSLPSAIGFGVLVVVASGVGIVLDRSEPRSHR